jgi:hypothetical protein
MIEYQSRSAEILRCRSTVRMRKLYSENRQAFDQFRIRLVPHAQNELQHLVKP